MESICQEAHRLTNGDRNADYGHPLDDFSHAAGIINAVLGLEIMPEDIPTIMICIKLARQENRHKRDNLVDIAGYANTAQMLRDELERRSNDAMDEMARISQEMGLYGMEADSPADHRQSAGLSGVAQGDDQTAEVARRRVSGTFHPGEVSGRADGV